jgi:hypothetical protein
MGADAPPTMLYVSCWSSSIQPHPHRPGEQAETHTIEQSEKMVRQIAGWNDYEFLFGTIDVPTDDVAHSHRENYVERYRVSGMQV